MCIYIQKKTHNTIHALKITKYNTKHTKTSKIHFKQNQHVHQFRKPIFFQKRKRIQTDKRFMLILSHYLYFVYLSLLFIFLYILGTKIIKITTIPCAGGGKGEGVHPTPIKNDWKEFLYTCGPSAGLSTPPPPKKKH